MCEWLKLLVPNLAIFFIVGLESIYEILLVSHFLYVMNKWNRCHPFEVPCLLKLSLCLQILKKLCFKTFVVHVFIISRRIHSICYPPYCSLIAHVGITILAFQRLGCWWRLLATLDEKVTYVVECHGLVLLHGGLSWLMEF